MADPALFHPDRGVLIAPSVLDANFGVLGDEIRRVESAGARLLARSSRLSLLMARLTPTPNLVHSEHDGSQLAGRE